MVKERKLEGSHSHEGRRERTLFGLGFVCFKLSLTNKRVVKWYQEMGPSLVGSIGVKTLKNWSTSLLSFGLGLGLEF